MSTRWIHAEAIPTMGRKRGEPYVINPSFLVWIDAEIEIAGDDKQVMCRVVGGGDILLARAGDLRSSLGIKRRAAA